MATGKGTTSRPARLQFKQKLVLSKPISTAELLKKLKVSNILLSCSNKLNL